MARSLTEEIQWLKENPEFLERPATLDEFLGPDYLNIEGMVRRRIRDELVEIMGDEVNPKRMTKWPYAMITGGIGIGKTTIASIVLPYMAHWTLCLKDPQRFFGLMPGSRIAFMQMSTSGDQAKEVVFGDIKARIDHSPWFKKYPYEKKFTTQIRFAQKDIWIIPGDSAETTFEGYNILGGILDEADSHKVTKNKDYAEQGYSTIDSRISSRFQDRGFMLVIGQMKKATGFAARKYNEFKNRPDAYAVRLAIWDSMGKDFYLDKDGGKTFYYDTLRKQILPSVALGALVGTENLIEVPELYRRQFENNPEKALRDLAGIPPVVGSPFISLVDRIHSARDRWIKRYTEAGVPLEAISPVRPDGRLEPWVLCHDPLKRVAHLDIAYSDQGDSLGLAVGHVREMVEIDGEWKPYIVFDLLMRMSAPPGGEIFLADVRHTIYFLRNELRFRIDTVTMDGFQSTDTMQQLKRRRFNAEYLSLDRQILPYHDLREAIYEERIEFPPYLVRYRVDDEQLVEIAVKELSELIDEGGKIDHPEDGSKDVADCIAGVTCTLMGARRFHQRGVPRRRNPSGSNVVPLRRASGDGFHHPAYRGDSGLRAPIPPTSPRWR